MPGSNQAAGRLGAGINNLPMATKKTAGATVKATTDETTQTPKDGEPKATDTKESGTAGTNVKVEVKTDEKSSEETPTNDTPKEGGTEDAETEQRKAALMERADQYFKEHPEVDVLWGCLDGNLFLDTAQGRNSCANHCRVTGQKKHGIRRD